MKNIKKLLFSFLILTINGVIYSQSWGVQNTNLSSLSRGVKDINIVDSNIVWAVGTDGSGGGGIVQDFTRTINGGTTWATGLINVGNSNYGINNLVAISSDVAWASATDVTTTPSGPYPGGVWKTVDGGTTWMQQNTGGFTDPNSFIDVVHFFDSMNGVVVGDPISAEFEVYITGDGGNLWTVVPGALLPAPAAGEAGLNGGNLGVGNTFFFVTNKGKLYRTQDKGLTWAKLSTPISDFAGTAVGGTIYFSDEMNGALLARATRGVAPNQVSTYKIYTTTNAGNSWSATGVDTTYSSLAYVPGTLTIVGTGTNAAGDANESAYSTDNGTSWTVIDNGIQRTEIRFLNISTGWAGGFTTDGGSGNFVGGIYKFSGNLKINEFNGGLTTVKINPNPTKGILKLTGAIINEVSVFDVLGKQVYNAKYNALNEVNVDISSLQTGVYMLKATNDIGATQTIKIMKN